MKIVYLEIDGKKIPFEYESKEKMKKELSKDIKIYLENTFDMDELEINW